MKPRLSIYIKLLLVIVPLVCVPIAVVGYFAVTASVDRVNQLVRQEQIVQLNAAAGRINDVLYNCRLDLETISGLPVLEDYYLARRFRLRAESRFNYDNLVRLFGDFLARARFYRQIRYLDQSGDELVRVGRKGPLPLRKGYADATWFLAARSLLPNEVHFSRLEDMGEDRWAMRCARPVISGWQQFVGVVVIDLDFDALAEVVRAIQVGSGGYAFMLDQMGRIIIHPTFKPYEVSLANLPEASLRELTVDMMQGGRGFRDYSFRGQNKAAAFAAVPALDWSLAVTIPRESLDRESSEIQTRVVQVVAITLVLTLALVGVLSYNLLKPVRSLALATQRIAQGDLSREIPVRSRDELGELTESFNRMMHDLARTHQELVRSEKLSSLGRLTAGVAHEIRNPLNAMKGAIVYLQRRRGEDPLIAEYTSLVLEEIDRLSRFVTEFLILAKQAPPTLKRTDLNELARDVCSLFANQALDLGIVLGRDLEPGMPRLLLDAHQMEQVLVNLVLNAMDACQSGGSVTISTRVRELGDPQARVELAVADDGQGIPDAQLGSIFDPFYTTKETGTGLGLTLSLGIAEGHGGTIRVTSREGAGTTVTVVLPARFAPSPKE